MNTTLRLFLELVNDAIHGRKTEEVLKQEHDIKRLIRYMNRTGVSAIVQENFCTALENGEPLEEKQEIITMWRQFAQNTAMRQMQQSFAIRKLQAEARKRNLTLVYFKGCILADLYPKYLLRSSSDTDIFVYETEKEEAIRMLEDLGYVWCESGSKAMVPVYYNEQLDHKIEMHFCLWEDYEGVQMRILEGFDLTNRDTLIPLNVCNGIEVMSMSHTNHLLYQIFHIVKHFAVEGIGLRYVTDVALFAERYIDEINWSDFWRKMRKLGYEKFTVTLFTLGIRYFELDGRVLCGRKFPKEEEIAPILEDLVICGEIKEHKEANWQILGIMTPYLEGEEAGSENTFHQKLSLLFPSVGSISDHYAYAKRHPILLPIAWIHRIFGFIKKRSFDDGDNWYSASEKMEIAQHRIHLMREQELLNDKKKQLKD